MRVQTFGFMACRTNIPTYPKESFCQLESHTNANFRSVVRVVACARCPACDFDCSQQLGGRRIPSTYCCDDRNLGLFWEVWVITRWICTGSRSSRPSAPTGCRSPCSPPRTASTPSPHLRRVPSTTRSSRSGEARLARTMTCLLGVTLSAAHSSNVDRSVCLFGRRAYRTSQRLP